MSTSGSFAMPKTEEAVPPPYSLTSPPTPWIWIIISLGIILIVIGIVVALALYQRQNTVLTVQQMKPRKTVTFQDL